MQKGTATNEEYNWNSKGHLNVHIKALTGKWETVKGWGSKGKQRDKGRTQLNTEQL